MIDNNKLKGIYLNNYGYLKDGIIYKEYSSEADGEVFKSGEIFEKKEGICYINIFGDKFTYNDFLNEANGNEDIAEGCFEMMVQTWNCPESYINDCMDEDWIVQCNDCMYLYKPGVESCPKCGSHELTDGRLIEDVETDEIIKIII